MKRIKFQEIKTGEIFFSGIKSNRKEVLNAIWKARKSFRVIEIQSI